MKDTSLLFNMRTFFPEVRGLKTCFLETRLFDKHGTQSLKLRLSQEVNPSHSPGAAITHNDRATHEVARKPVGNAVLGPSPEPRGWAAGARPARSPRAGIAGF